MPPLERAARAFAKAYLIESQNWFEGDPYVQSWVDAHWKDFRPHVREILMAVRHPGADLIARVRAGAVFAPDAEEIESAHITMIDALLEEAA
ncbi:hypothetical protein [Sphingobium cloacae]|uniref:hypothetical protein n=1 Tax=Sphingobium cloacae TaxID=120107 RepID=UPI0008308708|nr:hypothetical protein [Sphingobium cloacae]